MKNRNIKENHYIVFDLETTGLDPQKDQIIEISAQKIDHMGHVLARFDSFISLYKKEELDPFIVNLTSITTDILQKEGEDIDTVMDEFLEFISGSILVAQNAKFDMGFLIQYYLVEQNMAFTRVCLDTIELAKYIYPDKTSYKLSELVNYFDVAYDSEKHHRADYDVEITAQVLVKEFQLLDEYQTIHDLLTISNVRPYSEKQASFLDDLLGKANMHLDQLDYFTIQSASKHIDHLLNKRK